MMRFEATPDGVEMTLLELGEGGKVLNAHTIQIQEVENRQGS